MGEICGGSQKLDFLIPLTERHSASRPGGISFRLPASKGLWERFPYGPTSNPEAPGFNFELR